MDRPRVLICEDEGIVALEMQEKLKALGYDVVGVASNGPRAWEIARAEHPDIALMDIRLEGGIPGTEVARVLDQELQIPSIFLTAYADPETIEQASKCNPLGYLVKPVHDRDLETSLRFGLAHHKIKMNLKRQLEESTAQHGKAQSLLDEFSTSLRKEVRLQGLNDIVGGIAHYFNNSLAAVMPLALSLNEFDELPDYKAKRVNQLMNYLEAEESFVRTLIRACGKMMYERTRCSLQEVVTAAVKSRSAQRKSGVEIVTHLPPEPLDSLVNRPSIQKAIENLIDNSVESVTGQGIVMVSLNEALEELPERYGAEITPGWFNVVTVTDTGCGIPSEHLERVAEPFFSTRVERIAHGLGLTEAYGIIKGHGGWVTVESQVGVGTTVQMYIPKCAALDRTPKREMH